MAIGQHSGKIEVFDHNGPLPHERRRELVQRVGPNISDPPVQSCQLGFRFGTIVRSTLLAGK
jgi:hypothetical protein